MVACCAFKRLSAAPTPLAESSTQNLILRNDSHTKGHLLGSTCRYDICKCLQQLRMRASYLFYLHTSEQLSLVHPKKPGRRHFFQDTCWTDLTHHTKHRGAPLRLPTVKNPTLHCHIITDGIFLRERVGVRS